MPLAIVDQLKDPRSLRKQLESRRGSLASEYQTWKTHYQELAENMLPRSGRFLIDSRTEPNRSDGRNEGIINNTATYALRTMAAGLMAGASNKSRQWMRWQTDDPDLNKWKPARLWLDFATAQTFGAFLRSNLYEVFHQMYEELGVFGTAGSILTSHPQRSIHLHAMTAGQFMLAQDDERQINTLYRDLDMTVAQMVRKFGLSACSQEVQRLWGQGHLDVSRVICHAIEPREDRDIDKVDGKNMPWRSVYWEQGTAGDEVLSEHGFRQFPGVFPRWRVRPGDVYGSGPGMDCLQDQISLQHLEFRFGQAVDYGVKPALQAPSDMKNSESDSDPGSIDFTDQTGQGAGVRAKWEVKLDIPPLLTNMERHERRINAVYFADLFLMLYNADKNGMTAEEVIERRGEKMLMFGPAYQAIENGMLRPACDLTFQNLIEDGTIPPAPKELQGRDIKPEFVSMLAQAQRLAGIQNLDRFMTSIGAVAQVIPQVLDKVDADAYVDYMAETLTIPAPIVRDTDEVGELRKARNAAQAAQQQSAMMVEQAGVAKDTATAISKLPQEAQSAIAASAAAGGA